MLNIDKKGNRESKQKMPTAQNHSEFFLNKTGLQDYTA